MNKRIAILISDSIYNRKGMMNAEINRISHLQRISEYDINVYTFQLYTGWLVRRLRHLSKQSRPTSINIEGVEVMIKWRKFSLLDYLLTVKFHKSPIVNKNWEHKYMSLFKGYDLISANSVDMGHLAYDIKKHYGIPYFVTWHGSDIHTDPFANSYTFARTKQVLENAELNFMVSKALEETSRRISQNAKTKVLYNGVNDSFKRYSEDERARLITEKGVALKRVVAFAGSLVEVKNPQLFPLIFKAVKDKFNEPLAFWVMGSGKMASMVETECKEHSIPLTMWGDIPADIMPSMLNCVDVLILPSRNEGLPLIAAEALACGANAVGAKVGGIPEVMGEENTFSHGDNFVEQISSRIVYMLNNTVEQPLQPCFSWDETAKIENEIYTKYAEQS